MSHVRPGRTVVLAVATAPLLAAGLAVGSSRGSAGTSTSGSRAGKDGTYHTAVVAVVHAGKGYPLRANATVTLTRGRSRGTFKATSLLGGSITGSFTC
jgi:hypothetical protein